MPRITKHNHRYTLAYGNDHAMGLFIQVSEALPNGEDHYLVDMDQLFNPGLNEEQVKAIAEEYGFEIEL